MATTRPNFWLAILLFLLPTAARGASADTIPSGCPIVKVEVEQLPDLNIARAGHQVFCVNGEYVVAGDHTNGFIPTPTAEYFKDGEWHIMQMVYNHDFGGSVFLKSGKVLLFGGCEQPIGIGQPLCLRMYQGLRGLHVQRLLRSQIDKKLSTLWSEAGFASEQSFHRIFKQYTGLTPREWKDNA